MSMKGMKKGMGPKLFCIPCRSRIHASNWNHHLQSKSHEKKRFSGFSFKFVGKRKCPECQKGNGWKSRRLYTSKGLSIHCGLNHKGKRVVLQQNDRVRNYSYAIKGSDRWMKLKRVQSRGGMA